MRYGSQCALGGLVATAAAAIMVAALEASIAAMPAPAPLGIDPISIDRTHKGDRIPSLSDTRGSPVRTVPDAAPVPALEPRLPDGCVAAAEWRRASIYTAEVPGRCVG